MEVHSRTELIVRATADDVPTRFKLDGKITGDRGRVDQPHGLLLDRSGHTIHTRIKALFKRLDVHSRAELLAKLLAGKKSGRLP